jgi:uncharacterized protein YabE (DUF348 family)
MAKFSMKKSGKEVGQASVYAEPHTMDGKAMTTAKDAVVKPGKNGMDELNIAVAGISKGNTKPTKTSGIKMRGAGAATKGVMSRGPMA